MLTATDIVTRSIPIELAKKGSRRLCDSLFYLNPAPQTALQPLLLALYNATLAELGLLNWLQDNTIAVQRQVPMHFTQRQQALFSIKGRNAHLQLITLDNPAVHPLKQVGRLPLPAFVNPSMQEDSIYVFASITATPSLDTKQAAILPIRSRYWRTQALAPVTVTSPVSLTLDLHGISATRHRLIETSHIQAHTSAPLASNFAGLVGLATQGQPPATIELHSTALDDTFIAGQEEWLRVTLAGQTLTLWGWLSRAELREKSTRLEEKKQRIIPLLSLRSMQALIEVSR